VGRNLVFQEWGIIIGKSPVALWEGNAVFQEWGIIIGKSLAALWEGNAVFQEWVDNYWKIPCCFVGRECGIQEEVGLFSKNSPAILPEVNMVYQEGVGLQPLRYF